MLRNFHLFLFLLILRHIYGKYFGIFYTPEDQKSNVPSTLLELARQKGRAVQQGWRVRKNGSLFWASVVITAVHNKQNNIIGWSSIFISLEQTINYSIEKYQ